MQLQLVMKNFCTLKLKMYAQCPCLYLGNTTEVTVPTPNFKSIGLVKVSNTICQIENELSEHLNISS